MNCEYVYGICYSNDDDVLRSSHWPSSFYRIPLVGESVKSTEFSSKTIVAKVVNVTHCWGTLPNGDRGPYVEIELVAVEDWLTMNGRL